MKQWSISFYILILGIGGSFAARVTDISLIGFSNYVECSTGHGLLWYTMSQRPFNDSVSLFECPQISNYHWSKFESVIKKVGRIVRDRLSNLNKPVLICVVVGQTLWPKLKWTVNSKKVPNGVTRQEFFNAPMFKKLLIVISYINVDEDVSSFYECSVDVGEICTRDNHPAKVNLHKMVHNESSPYNEKEWKQGECRSLNPNSYCSRFRAGDVPLIFIREKFTDSRLQTEMKLETILSNMFGELGPKCINHLRSMLCTYLFPVCDADRQLQPCREACYQIFLTECDQSISYMDRKVSMVLRDHFDINWRGCQDLPSSADLPVTCFTTMYHQREFDYKKRSKVCFREHDRHYAGRLNKTNRGLTCQHWNSLCPNDHDKWPEFYPELYKAENFCRNPGGEKVSPWCFTLHPNVTWDYCKIPLCTFDIESDDSSTPLKSTERKSSSGVNAIVTLLAVAAFLICCFVCFFYYRFRSTKVSTVVVDPQQPMWSSDISVDLQINATYGDLSESSETNFLFRKMEFARNELVGLKIVARSAHKIIYKAKCARCTSTHLDMPKEFIVKSLLLSAPEDELASLRLEASAMLEFDHENVVKMLAVCFIGRPACLIFELMPYGDLKHFLRRYGTAGTLFEGDSDIAECCSLCEEEKNALSESDLWSIALQIARGMRYVSSLNYVHRDLAARNCLVGVGFHVKISDFEMCRRLSSDVDAMYVGAWDEPVAVRWAAPEVHEKRWFSTYSDVWAFGVILWEMCTFGMQPYFGLSHGEVAEYVCSGKVLAQPDVASDELYNSVMLRCWERVPRERLTFELICEYFLNELC